MRSILFVFLGSGLGGALRHSIGLAALRLLGPDFPYGTLTINVAGSALMGLAAGIFATHGPLSYDFRLFLMTGLIGGFTTWSTFSLDVVVLWEHGEAFAAAAYVAASLFLSLALMTLVLLATRRFI